MDSDHGAMSPFVGRNVEQTYLRGLAAEATQDGGRLVVVSGPSGIGKTRLCMHVLDELGRRWRRVSTVADVDGDLDAVLLDDIHRWPLDRLESVMTHRWPDGVLALATCDIGVRVKTARARHLLRDLARQPHVSILSLGPLGPADAEELTARLGVTSSAERSHLHARSGGNPFLLEELCRDPAVNVPWTVQAMVDELLSELSDGARRRLEVLAMAMAPMKSDAITDVCGAPPTGELVDTGLVAGADGPQHLVSGVVADAVRASMDPERVRLLHRRIAEHLIGEGADAADIALHVRPAGDDVEAAAWGLRAAEAAFGAGATTTAYRWYEAVLGRTDGPLSGHAPAVLERAAVAAASIGAHESAEDWAWAADRGYRQAGEHDAARRMWAQRTLRYVRQPPSPSPTTCDDDTTPDLAAVASEAEAAARAGEHEQALDLAGRAVHATDAEVAARAAQALYLAGDPAGGIGVLRRLRRDAAESGDFLGEAWRLADLAGCTAGLGDLAGAIGFERTAHLAARRSTQDVEFPSLQLGLAAVLGMAGEIDEAESLAESLADNESPVTRLLAHLPMMMIDVSRGRPADAVRRAAELAPFKEFGGPFLFAAVMAVDAHARFFLGDHDACLDVLDELDSWVGGIFEQTIPDRLELRARVASATGDIGALDRLLERTAAAAGHRMAGPALVGAHALATGLRAKAAGDATEALTALRDAAGAYERAPRALAAGMTWCDAAEVALSRGERTQAVSALAAARSVAMRGVTAVLDRHRLLEEMLQAPIAHDGLTPREVDLLQLLAEGRTNKDIASALHLAPATVRNQLHSLFAKLGVRRRAEAAALAVRLGVGGSSA